jgi:hypothetical protein
MLDLKPAVLMNFHEPSASRTRIGGGDVLVNVDLPTLAAA